MVVVVDVVGIIWHTQSYPAPALPSVLLSDLPTLTEHNVLKLIICSSTLVQSGCWIIYSFSEKVWVRLDKTRSDQRVGNFTSIGFQHFNQLLPQLLRFAYLCEWHIERKFRWKNFNIKLRIPNSLLNLTFSFHEKKMLGHWCLTLYNIEIRKE